MQCDRDGCARRADHRLRVMVPGWRVPEAVGLCVDHASDLATLPIVDGVIVLPGACSPPRPILPPVAIRARPKRRAPRPVPYDPAARRKPGETIEGAIVRVLGVCGELTACELHFRVGARKIYHYLRRLSRRGAIVARGARPAWYRLAGAAAAQQIIGTDRGTDDVRTDHAGDSRVGGAQSVVP